MSNETTNSEQRGLTKIPDELPSNLKEQLVLAEQLVKSGLCPHKKPEDALVAILMGRELGFKPMVALSNIHSINGKAGIGIHLITAILSSNNIRMEILKDYEDVITPNPNNSDATNDNKPKNKETTVRLTRWFKNPDGTYDKIHTTSSFSLLDAHFAGLLDKDNWKKHPKAMLRTRAIAICARLAASDLLNGVFEYNELMDMNNKDGNINNNGEPVVEAEIVINK